MARQQQMRRSDNAAEYRRMQEHRLDMPIEDDQPVSSKRTRSALDAAMSVLMEIDQEV